MAHGIGRAFARAVREGPLRADRETEGPTLANTRRRQVFRYLCWRPCARVGDIVRDLSMSQATVRWHEWDLLEHGYVQIERSRVFPVGLIDSEDAALFALLAAPGRAAVFASTCASPGRSYHEVARTVELSRQSVSKIAQELSDHGLVKVIEDGRFRRLKPTDCLAQKREANRPREAAFVDTLLRRLADDGLSPELVRRDESSVLVQIGIGSLQVVLELPLNPYVTAWSGLPD